MKGRKRWMFNIFHKLCCSYFAKYIIPSPLFSLGEDSINIYHHYINQPPSLILIWVKVRSAKISLLWSFQNSLFNFPFSLITQYVMLCPFSLSPQNLAFSRSQASLFASLHFFLLHYNLILWLWHHLYSDDIQNRKAVPDIF